MADKTLGQILSNVVLGDHIFEGVLVWSDWTPVFNGFSVDPTAVMARFIQIGKAVFVRVRMPNTGTSNSIIFTMTMPFVSGADGATWGTLASHVDNGVREASAGIIRLPPSSNVANFRKDGSLANFTASGGKSADFLFIYEIP